VSVIHPLRLRYSNAYLVVGERPILVDTGSRGDAPKLVAGCAAAGVKIRDLALILHTHVHSDHFGNTAELAAEAGCPVAYHPGDRSLAIRGDNGPLRGVGLRGRILARLVNHLPFRTLAADIDAVDAMRLDEFGMAASVLHTPGHTPGSISVILDSGDAIIGDVIMGGYAGGAIRPSQPNFHYFADDLPAAMASLDRILAATYGRLFVGHGGPVSHEAVVTWRRRHNGRRWLKESRR
jgi:glyoxylase-like metal-dependent hydrolase (beta-lactamase superfamily II)